MFIRYLLCALPKIKLRVFSREHLLDMKNILVVGNHTCGNRGDCAILRGLITELRHLQPDIHITTLSRFPESSRYLLQDDIEVDRLNAYRQRRVNRFSHKIIKYLINKLLTRFLLFIFNKPQHLNKVPLPKAFKQEFERIKKYDAVIQLGGSFFVDMYGDSQFDYALATLISGTPLFVVSHSVGPFRSPYFKKLAECVFNRANAFILRESVSLERLKHDNIYIENIQLSSDSAWLVQPPQNSPPAKHKVIAVTFRNLAPFDSLLNISQDQYEQAFASLIDTLNEAGYHVKAFSTCTGIDGYPKDDRMPALRVQRLCKDPSKMVVIMDELNDIELGTQLSECLLTIGTRLHSAIISMNFGTPAFALNYEHKSDGIMKQLGLPELAQPISALLDGSLSQKALSALQDIDKLNQQVEKAVLEQKNLASQTLQHILQVNR